jgi:hypothetical protein
VAKAALTFQLRLLRDDSAIVEMRIWRVIAPVLPSTHRFTYSVFYGRPGERIVLFDNERGKGDQRHPVIPKPHTSSRPQTT